MARPLMIKALASSGCLVLAACSSGDSAKVTLPKDFKLKSASITLPDWSKERFPAGPGAEAMDNNCRTCHSPSMVLVQPPLKHEDWAKELDKMRNVYKAPVPDSEIPAIAAYLDAYSAKLEATLGAGRPVAK